MLVRYLCIGHYWDKKEGDYVSTLAPLSEGIGTKTEKSYQISKTAMGETMKVPGKLMAGEIVTYQLAQAVVTADGEVVVEEPKNGKNGKL